MSGEKEMERETILVEAQRIVYGDRAVSYGNPEDNFAAIAALWTAYICHEQGHSDFILDAADVALMMVLFKIGRMTTGIYKRDNAVDLAGYAECYSRIMEIKKT